MDKKKIRAHFEQMVRESNAQHDPSQLERVLRVIDRHQWLALVALFLGLVLVGALEWP